MTACHTGPLLYFKNSSNFFRIIIYIILKELRDVQILRLNIFPIWHYNNSNQIKKHEKEETQTERKKTTQDLPESEIVVSF